MAHVLNRELLAFRAVPAGLEIVQSLLLASLRHGIREVQIFRGMHHHLQFLHPVQYPLKRGLVSLRGQGDPVEASAQRIHPAGFQMQGETASRIEALGEGLQIVMQRFSTGDHNEAGPGFSSHLGGISQGIDGLLRVPLGRP